MAKVASKKSKEYLKYRNITDDNYEILRNFNSVDTLPAGAYKIEFDYWGNIYIKRSDIITDELVEIDSSVTKVILDEIKDFYSPKTKAKYAKNKFVYKRGVLLHGAPGGGKSSLIAKVIEDSINKDYLILLDPDVHSLETAINAIRDIEPSRFIVVVFEDIDQLISHSEVALLSILDGRKQIDNVLYIATTNFLDRIPARFKNRPSRFAKIIEVGLPQDNVREAFFKAKLDKEDHWLIEALVSCSNGFSFDQMKELIVNVMIYDLDPEDAAKRILRS